MLKKTFTFFMAALFFVFFIETAFAEKIDFIKGDKLQVVFSVERLENIAGVSVELDYNDVYLKVTDANCSVGGSAVNLNYDGVVRWNFISYDGISFDGEDVAVVEFEVLRTGTGADLGIVYNCEEIFDIKSESPEGDLNDYVKAKIVFGNDEFFLPIMHDETMSSDTVSEVYEDNSSIASDTDSSLKSESTNIKTDNNGQDDAHSSVSSAQTSSQRSKTESVSNTSSKAVGSQTYSSAVPAQTNVKRDISSNLADTPNGSTVDTSDYTFVISVFLGVSMVFSLAIILVVSRKKRRC